MSLSPLSRNVVYSSADYLVETLHHEICKNHDPEEHTLAKIILLLYDMRSYDVWHDEAASNMIEDALELELSVSGPLLLLDEVHR